MGESRRVGCGALSMLLIDGHNLIGRAPGLSLEREEEAREVVLRRVAAAKGSGGRRILVFFDGDRPGAARETRFGGVRVVFAAAGGTADEEILRRLRRGNPRAATVVTSDRGLGAEARALGAQVESCEAFWSHLSRQKPQRAVEKPEGGPEEVEAWLRVFQGRKGGEHKM